MTPLLSRRLLTWLFALTLLLGQAAAFAHALTHLHARDTALPDKVCVAQAQLGCVAPPHALVLAIPSGDCIVPSSTAPLRVDLAPCPACACAPPAPFNT